MFAADEVASKLEESEDQIKTMKRKHAAVVKVCLKFLITSYLHSSFVVMSKMLLWMSWEW